MPYFDFRQNNTGGDFVHTRGRLSVVVIVEADSPEEANDRLVSLGGYFDGCDDGFDCACCGDRWYRAWSNDGTAEPTVYGEPVEKYLNGDYVIPWVAPNPHVYVHHADGRVEAHCAPERRR